MATTNKTCPKGQYWDGKKCVKQLNEGAFNDIGTRAQASIIKLGESMFGLTPGDRTVREQAQLNKDKALHLSNAARAKEEAKKQAAYKAKVKAMQTGPNGYQKKGGSVGTKKTKMALGGVKKYQKGGGPQISTPKRPILSPPPPPPSMPKTTGSLVARPSRTAPRMLKKGGSTKKK